MTPPFAIVEAFESARIGLRLAGLRPGRPQLVESPARLRRAPSYSFVHAAILLQLADGRRGLSVPPGAAAAAPDDWVAVDPAAAEFADRLAMAIEPALRAGGLGPVNRRFADRVFACGAAELRRHHHGDLRRLRDETIPAHPDLSLPTHCFADGTAYGVVAEGQVVAVAYAHRIGEFEPRLADLGVATAVAWRRQGLAQTVVSAVAAEVIALGGEARYGCRPENLGSVATARSCGFVDWANSLVLACEP